MNTEEHKQRSLQLQLELDNIQHESGRQINARHKTEQDKQRISQMIISMSELQDMIHYHRVLAGSEKE